jgi:hypothetical protein
VLRVIKDHKEIKVSRVIKVSKGLSDLQLRKERQDLHHKVFKVHRVLHPKD